MDFPKKLKKLLEDRNITQLQLAEEIGKTKWVVNNWIRGISKPSALDLELLATFFKISISDLLPSSADVKTLSERIIDITTDFYFNCDRTDSEIDTMFRTLNEIYIQAKNSRVKK